MLTMAGANPYGLRRTSRHCSQQGASEEDPNAAFVTSPLTYLREKNKDTMGTIEEMKASVVSPEAFLGFEEASVDEKLNKLMKGITQFIGISNELSDSVA